jgi:hypothetical protein
MEVLKRLIFATALAGLAMVVTNAPSDAARRGPTRSSYDGDWSVVIYTLRGDCGSVRAALRIVGGRAYSVDQSYQAYGAVGSGGAVRVTIVSGSQSASAGCRIVRERVDGVRPGGNAPALGRPRGAAPITELFRRDD